MASLNGNTFRITCPLWGKPPITGGSLSQRASVVDLWCFFWFHLAQTAEQTVVWQVNLDVLVFIWLRWNGKGALNHRQVIIPPTTGHNAGSVVMPCLGGMSTWLRNSWIQCGQRWNKKTPNVSTIRFIGLYGMNHYFIMVNCIFGWRHMPYIPHYACIFISWWRHQMETFSTLLALCERNPMSGRFLSQCVNNAEFWCFRCFTINKHCNKQSSCRWFQTPKSPRGASIMTKCAYLHFKSYLNHGRNILFRFIFKQDKTPSFHKGNVRAAGHLAWQGDRARAAMILTWIIWNNRVLHVGVVYMKNLA